MARKTKLVEVLYAARLSSGRTSIPSVITRPSIPIAKKPIATGRQIITHTHSHTPENIAGNTVTHTPIFWQHEKQMIPERSTSWGWIWTNFSMCLRRDVKAECIHVRKNWKKYANTPRCSWGHCKTLQTSFVSEKVTL